MRQGGIEGEIKKAASKNVPIIGICGGYQMLGESLVTLMVQKEAEK